MSKDYTPGESHAYHDGYGQGLIDSYDLVREKCIKDALKWLSDKLYIENNRVVTSCYGWTVEEVLKDFTYNMRNTTK